MALIRAKSGFWSEFRRLPRLKKLFWAYFLLLIFEGALRKWILPQFSAPLLLVRDPISILIIWEAYRTHKWPKKWTAVASTLATMIIGIGMIQIVLGSVPWFVLVYGLRSYLMPLPVAFIMAENLTVEDLRKFGNCALLLMLPLTAVEIVQYYSSPSSPWNAAVSSGAEQLAYAGGHVRASATFSYVSGPASYIPLVAAFVFYGFAKPGFTKRWLLWASCVALILSVPVTGSRTIAFTLAILLAFVGIAGLFGVSQFVKSIQIILALAFVGLLVSQLPVFSDAANTFTERFTAASRSEGGSVSETILVRSLFPVALAVESNVSTGNWLGHGIGYGAGAMSQLLTGQQSFLAGEGEFERVLGEFGWPCGLGFMLIRWLLGLTIAARAVERARNREPLAWLLVPLALPSICQNVLENPTEQGFFVIAVAFSLTALKQIPVTPTVLDPRRLRPRRITPLKLGHGAFGSD